MGVKYESSWKGSKGCGEKKTNVKVTIWTKEKVKVAN